MTRNDLPVNKLQEFIGYAKANQSKMQYGSAGTGSAVQLSCVLLNAANGLKITHVPYRGSAPAIQDLIGGRIDYQCANVGPAIAQIEGKLVKPIALLSRNRTAILPSLPTADEQGMKGFEAVLWYAFFLPKGTPAPIVQKLHDATVATMDSPSIIQWMKQNGADLAAPDRRSPDYLQKFVESEIVKWAGPIKAAGVRRGLAEGLVAVMSSVRAASPAPSTPGKLAALYSRVGALLSHNEFGRCFRAGHGRAGRKSASLHDRLECQNPLKHVLVILL